MNYEQLIILVASMREAQKKYFKNRAQQNLLDAKLYESQVDREIRRWEWAKEEKENPGLSFGGVNK